jgi:hypothetical protein
MRLPPADHPDEELGLAALCHIQHECGGSSSEPVGPMIARMSQTSLTYLGLLSTKETCLANVHRIPVPPRPW